MLDEEMLFVECERYLLIRKYIEEFEHKNRGDFMCLYKICKILCESRMIRRGSDIRGYWDPKRRKIEGIYDENSSDETYFILFKDEFEKKDNKCFMWMFKIFNGKREGQVKRYRRKENIYMIWEYLFKRKNIKENSILRKCLEYRLKEFHKKNRSERFIFLTAAIDIAEVLGSEMIAYPNTKLMCSVNVDGSAAAVLCSEKKMRALGLSKRAVLVRASALASDPFSPRNTVMPDLNAVTQLAANSAYESGGIGPADIDLVELHDCFATAEICHYENLQLCTPGEGASLLESGATALGGKIPVNVSGGLLSKGHPLGATGIANVCEIVMQLRGEAGARQVANARIGMTHVVGLGSACAVHILERV